MTTVSGPGPIDQPDFVIIGYPKGDGTVTLLASRLVRLLAIETAVFGPLGLTIRAEVELHDPAWCEGADYAEALRRATAGWPAPPRDRRPSQLPPGAPG